MITALMWSGTFISIVVLALLLRKSGRDAEKLFNLEEEWDAASRARDIDVEVDKMTDEEKREWLKKQLL